MTNKEIADTFQHLARLMELHGENPFKIRSYINAYNTFRKYPQPVAEMSQEELAAIKGVGKAISQKTRELVETGQLSALEKYLEKTPPGIRQLLKIKGLGPKKIKALWEGPGIETPGELLYACNENRLIELKGFGQKTQEDIRKKLEYFLKSQGKYLFADIEAEAEKVLQYVQQMMPSAKASHAGALRRKCNVVEKIELVVGADNDLQPLFKGRLLNLKKHNAGVWSALTDEGFPVKIYHCLPGQFGSKLFLHTAAPAFLEAFLKKTKNTNFKGLSDERMVFKKAGLPFIEPEMRENNQALQLAAQNALPQLIVPSDVKGVVHAHTTYSDGINTLRQMAEYAKAQGFEYLGISDHSKAAFYANGLKEDRLQQQWDEIDALNAELAPFKIFKGIEADILADGSLDYDHTTRDRFDFLIASIHSNLKMDAEKANRRLLKAIENPHTRMLGHPTGRLLLSRPGYPMDHRKVIDACAANDVAIELNANPYRLDLDWSHISYAIEKGVLIAINPDAHSIAGINDIRFGVFSARKGGLPAEKCLTCFDLKKFEKWIIGKGK